MKINIRGHRFWLSGKFTRSKSALQKAIRDKVGTVTTVLDQKVQWVVLGEGAEISAADVAAWPCRVIDEKGLEAVLKGRDPDLEVADAPAAGEAADGGGFDVTGKKVVVTGKFSQMTRDEINTELLRRGAEVSGSVSSKTDILIAGDKAGSKLDKARAYGVRIISEKALVDILKQEATVEVAPRAKDAPAVPARFEGKTIPGFKGREVVITGSFGAFTKAELGAIITASGGKVVPNVKTSIKAIVSGDKWGRKLREAIARRAAVWTEGEVLLALEGRKGEFPEPADVPNGQNLSALDAIEEGRTVINTPPGVDGELVLEWKKVAFKTHRRFGEIFGLAFLKDPEHAWVGKLSYNGEALTPGGENFYGPESFNMTHFWENGSDAWSKNLKYDGTHGFNCSCFNLRPKMHINWERQGGSWFHDMRLEGAWFGDVCVMIENEWLRVDFDKKTVAVSHFTGPYVVSEHEPWGS